jgi:uncharacterized protein (DUF1697 family)
MLREGVDKAYPGAGAMYYSVLWAQATKSRIPRLVGSPLYQNMTIRNWNTTIRMLALAKATEGV